MFKKNSNRKQHTNHVCFQQDDDVIRAYVAHPVEMFIVRTEPTIDENEDGVRIKSIIRTLEEANLSCSRPQAKRLMIYATLSEFRHLVEQVTLDCEEYMQAVRTSPFSAINVYGIGNKIEQRSDAMSVVYEKYADKLTVNDFSGRVKFEFC